MTYDSVKVEELQIQSNTVAAEIAGLNLDNLRLRNLSKYGGRIWDMIQNLLGNIDLSSMTKDEFLAKVDSVYDSMVAPAIISINPLIGPMLNGVLNGMVLAIAGRFYDNHS